MRQKKILIVDDDIMIVKTISNYLRNLTGDYILQEAYNGKEGLKRAREEQPELILLDWEMPLMQGIDVLNALKLDKTTREIPVVMATSRIDSINLDEALTAGAIDYIRKPIDKVELLARLHSVLRLSESHKKIMDQNKILEQHQQEIEKRNRKTYSSLSYASRIQSALLISETNFKQHLPESFVFFKPKEIVSGDFYWINQLRPANLTDEESNLLVAAVDCTGHGIPGAMMSMLGISYLNEIVQSNNIHSPDMVLKHLDEKVKQNLQQDTSANHDGMEAALCLVDYQNSIVEFAGASQPLLYIQNEEVHLIDGEENNIGGSLRNTQTPFKKHTIPFRTPTEFYIYTDGYQDQFGGEKRMKFMRKKLRQLLFRIHTRPMSEQKKILQQTLSKWMQNENQTDDILIIGFRL